MDRSYYSDTISKFIETPDHEIIGILTKSSEFNVELLQRNAWQSQIDLLKSALVGYQGCIFFEYAIPRMGKRIDTLLIIDDKIFIIEFKVGDNVYSSSALDQVWDYALDLKHFHETSRNVEIIPILVATNAHSVDFQRHTVGTGDKISYPLKTNTITFSLAIRSATINFSNTPIDVNHWINGRYSPTPTIIEAAISLFNNHDVLNISRNDAGAKNLTITSNSITEIIDSSKSNKKKSICFVTGVPGAGKTLVGLNIATKNAYPEQGISSVFLSGNGPLVKILREALTRDIVERKKSSGTKIKKSDAGRAVNSFIQNVHHFRDECLKDPNPPSDHVAIFDEAQRAWNQNQTVKFMAQKKGVVNFKDSESKFLISCLDRHQDWAVIVCLVGGGQELNTGEAGISEWLVSLRTHFPHWDIYISNKLTEDEYIGKNSTLLSECSNRIFEQDELHLSVSMRSFRAEHLSTFVKLMLDKKVEEGKQVYQRIKDKYPIVLARDMEIARNWLRNNARGTERYGIVASSQAIRLKPHAINVKYPIDPIHWFLNGKEDIRSSYYLEDVATEFHVQGLELDWVCVAWDADFRHSKISWDPYSFVGSKWQRILKNDRKVFLKNAYRVLLTRARQGMVIVVPEGKNSDPTRKEDWYNGTWEYLRGFGIPSI